MTCIHATVSRSPRKHASVPPNKRHCRQWMSSLFCGFLPNPLSMFPYWRSSHKFVKTDLHVSIVFDVSLECRLFDRVRADNQTVLHVLHVHSWVGGHPPGKGQFAITARQEGIIKTCSSLLCVCTDHVPTPAWVSSHQVGSLWMHWLVVKCWVEYIE